MKRNSWSKVMNSSKGQIKRSGPCVFFSAQLPYHVNRDYIANIEGKIYSYALSNTPLCTSSNLRRKSP